MNELLEGLRQSFADPVTRHAMLVHFPIAGVFLAVPFVVALVAIPHRPARAYRIVLAVAVFMLGVIAWQAGEAGESAEPIVEARLRSDADRAVLHDHAIWGERVAPLLAIAAGLVAGSLVPRRGVRLGAGLASTAAILGICVVVVVTAHGGGRLVHWLDPGSVAGLSSP